MTTLVTPASLDEIARAGEVLLAGGTEVVPQLKEGLLEAEALVDLSGLVPRGIDGSRIGAGTTLAEIEASDAVPDALREACRLAASPQLRSMGTVGGNLLQSTRCWYWRLGYDCRLRGGDRCHARDGEHREHAIFANDFCASAHPSDVAAALARARRAHPDDPARARAHRALPAARRRTTAARSRSSPARCCSSSRCPPPTPRST